MSKTEGKKDKKREKQSKDDDKKVKKSLKSLDAMPSEVSTEAPPAKAPAPVREEQSEAPLQPRGLFNSAEKTFEVFYPEESVKLTIKKFQGKAYVDIRKTFGADNLPTKKGISISPDLFRKLQQFSQLEEGLNML